MKENRYSWIDVVKGISICLVMFGHVEHNDTPFKKWFSLFYVTTFLVVSGYLFGLKNKDVKSLKPMLLKIAWPYIWFSLFAIIVNIIINLYNKNALLKPLIVDGYKTITLYGILALWYLPSYYISSAIFLTIKEKANVLKLCVFAMFLTILSIAVSFMLKEGSNILTGFVYDLIQYPIVAIFRSLSCVLFICIGYTLFETAVLDVISNTNRILTGIILLLVTYLLSLYALDRNFSMLNYGTSPFSLFLGGATGSIGLIMILYKSENKILQWFGKNSLLLLITHMTFKITTISQYITKYIVEKNSIFYSLFSFLIMLFFEVIIVYLFNHIFKFFVYRKKNS